MKRKKTIVCCIVMMAIFSLLVIAIKKNTPAQKNLKETVESSDKIDEDSEGDDEQELIENTQSFSDNNESMSGKNYEIYDLTKNNVVQYQYKIFNNDGKTVRNEIIADYPNIEYVRENLLSIEMGAGSDIWLTEYYDTIGDKFSETYESPLETYDNKVVYMNLINDEIYLMIQDIFDKNRFYKEFRLDFAPVAVPVNAIESVEFVNGKELKISYLSGENYIEKTTMLSLY